MSDGPSFKPYLLGSATVTILCRPIREVRVARPLVRRDRLGARSAAHKLVVDAADVPLHSQFDRPMMLERNSWARQPSSRLIPHPPAPGCRLVVPWFHDYVGPAPPGGKLIDDGWRS